MAKPLILYRSLAHPRKIAGLTEPVITVTPAPAAGFTIADGFDYKSYSLWKSGDITVIQVIDIDLNGSHRDADYIAFVNHNLKSANASVEVLADSFTPPTTVRSAAALIAEDVISYRTFTAPGTLRYWRVTISDLTAYPFDATPFFGEMFLGLKTELPEFLSPRFEPFFKNVEISGSRSEGGHFLAATQRGQTHRGVIEFGGAGAARAAFTSDLNAFFDEHAFKRLPFLFVLDTADTDFDVARYLKMTDDGSDGRRAVGDTWQRLGLAIDVEEAFMEPA